MTRAGRDGPATGVTGDDLPHGARIVQELLDGETRPIPPALRAVGDAAAGTSGVSRERYTSRAVHELEVAKVWRRTWQMACREEQIPEVGDSVVYVAPGVSLVVVRSGPDDIRAFHNSCLHRGTQLRTQPGSHRRAALSLPRLHLEPRRHLRRHAVPVGLSPRRSAAPSAFPRRGWEGGVGSCS